MVYGQAIRDAIFSAIEGAFTRQLSMAADIKRMNVTALTANFSGCVRYVEGFPVWRKCQSVGLVQISHARQIPSFSIVSIHAAMGKFWCRDIPFSCRVDAEDWVSEPEGMIGASDNGIWGVKAAALVVRDEGQGFLTVP
ncbi:hypothetical protein AA0229_0796 [Gluconobacter cerinus NRIC 0229]|nr:hypothetical protein AA0229_0796 [Gluconobacter cerinus NRIC 0229]